MHQPRLAGRSLRYERWNQRVGAYSRLPALIRQLGVDPGLMLRRSGISAEAIARPEARVPYQALVTLLREAAGETACPHLGLLAGRMSYLADLGAVGDAVRHSPTVGEALQLLVAHQHLNGDGGLTFLLRRGPVVDWGYAIYQPGVLGEQMYDAALAAAVNFMRELYGPSWLPSEVFLPYAKRDDMAHHRSYFKVQPHFNAEYCALRFPVEQLDMPVAGADPQRLRAAVQLLSTYAPRGLAAPGLPHGAQAAARRAAFRRRRRTALVDPPANAKSQAAGIRHFVPGNSRSGAVSSRARATRFRYHAG